MGRPVSHDTRRPAPILQVADKGGDLDAKVDEAFRQIHDRRYYEGMEGRIILIGLAFCDKTPRVRIDSVMNGDGFGLKGSGAGES